MPITAGDVKFKGSVYTAGGKPHLGGAAAAVLTSQTCSVPAIVTGVAVLDAVGNQAGQGQLSYNPSNQGLAWQPPGAQSADGQIITTSGTYTIGGPSGILVVSVVTGILPSIYKVESLLITDTINAVFDDVSPNMALDGFIQYRCLYLYNAHPTLAIMSPKLFVSGQPAGPNQIAIGVDPAGVGDGATTGVATTIANENTAPVGVTFSAPATASSGIALPNIPAGQSIAVWQRRSVPMNSFGDIAVVSAQIGLALIG